jgi:hypothetical protein
MSASSQPPASIGVASDERLVVSSARRRSSMKALIASW